MKKLSLVLLSSTTLLLAACETVTGPNGQPRSVMTPLGAGILQTVIATGVGAGSGALLRNQQGWANGMVSGGVSSIASQAVNAFVPQTGYQQTRYAQPQYSSPQYPVQNGYNQPRPSQGQTLYYRRPDGSFAPVQQ